MLTAIDTELFPDDCEVVELPSHGLRVYLIQKNGSSSVRDEAAIYQWPCYHNEEIRTLDYVDVFIRDPLERYLSGINTFTNRLAQSNKDLDLATCQLLANQYKFLNRHYLPQWHWLVNLARFVRDDCRLRLHPIDELKKHTRLRHGPPDVGPLDKAMSKRMVEDSKKLEYWLFLDKILIDLCGQELTWKSIMSIYRSHPARPLDPILNQFNSIAHVLL